jgi:DNA polymerase-4
VSAEIHKIFEEYTEIIEPLSLDEAYLDVTEVHLCKSSASLMAKEIREKIFNKINLTASAGISYNKFLAKLGSDQNKPNGQFIIKPGEAKHYIHDLPIGRFYGVGKVTEAKMKSFGINTGGDLKEKSLLELQKILGNSAEYYYDIARGIDFRPVSNQRVRKSLGSETTFQHDISDTEEMIKQLFNLLDEILKSLLQRELLAYTITLKIKYSDFTQITRSYTSDTIISVRKKAIEVIPVLLAKTEVKTKSVRLLGISFSNLLKPEDLTGSQLQLF